MRPKSPGPLDFIVDVSHGRAPNVIPYIFQSSAWKNLLLLGSFVPRADTSNQSVTGSNLVINQPSVISLECFIWLLDSRSRSSPLVLEGIGLRTHLQSFTLMDGIVHASRLSARSCISFTEVQWIHHDRLGSASYLQYVDIYDKIFRLVDREGLEIAV